VKFAWVTVFLLPGGQSRQGTGHPVKESRRHEVTAGYSF
jgi:hypothetical protein